MNFSIVTPNDVYNWIIEKGNGNDSDYNKGKEDTQEAIEVFQSLYGMQLDSIQELFNYLKTNLSMRVAESNSLYRAFIVLNNDEIMSIRFSQHPATRNSVTKAIKSNGKPNLEYHLIVDRVKDINPHKDFYKDRTFKKVSFTIRDFSFSQLCDGNTRKGVIDEIIYLLTYGTGNNNKQINTESKSMNTNKKIVRLTESQLHNIIAESVKKIMNESRFYDTIFKDFQNKFGKEATDVTKRNMRQNIFNPNSSDSLDKLRSRNMNEFDVREMLDTLGVSMEEFKKMSPVDKRNLMSKYHEIIMDGYLG